MGSPPQITFRVAMVFFSRQQGHALVTGSKEKLLHVVSLQTAVRNHRETTDGKVSFMTT